MLDISFGITALERLEEIKRNFAAGVFHAFLLWGNLGDYLSSGQRTLRQHLLEWLKEVVDIIIFYDLDDGLHFPFPEHEEAFQKIMMTEMDPNTKALGQMSKRERESFQKAKEKLEDRQKQEKLKLPTDPAGAIQLVRGLIENQFGHKNPPKIAFLIDYAKTLAPRSFSDFIIDDRITFVSLSKLMKSDGLNKGSIVILLTKDVTDINTDLVGRDSRLKTVKIPMPRPEERSDFAQNLIKQRGFKSEINQQEIAQLTGGLTLREMGQIFLMEKVITINVIRREKERIYRDEVGDVVKITEPRWGVDKGLGGLEHIKEFVHELKPALLRGDPLLVPPAILLMGPPGTGKSALAEAIAYEWGVPFLEIVNFRTVWHGESEKNALRVWNTAESLYPCVLWWDEFDQEETSRSSPLQDNTGVSNRLRQIRFKVTSDPKIRGKVLVIYATNRPDLIDPADKRSGRASVRLAMLMPDVEEMAEIYEILPEREGFKTEVTDFRNIANVTAKTQGKSISGADIVEISLGSYQFSLRRKESRGIVTQDDYLAAINDFMHHPLKAEEIRRSEELAVEGCSSKRLMSKRGLEIWERLQQQLQTKKDKKTVV